MSDIRSASFHAWDSLSMERPFLEALRADQLVFNSGSVLHQLWDLAKPWFPRLSSKHGEL